jgi:uncharacterized protein (TIGR03118 family)
VRRRRLLAVTVAAAIAGGSLAGLVAADSPSGFRVTALVTDPGYAGDARARDSKLVNGWGLAATATGPWWVTSEARNAGPLYAGDGHKQVMTIDVPCGPTGIAAYGGQGFVVHGGGASAPARFVYACEDGTIRAWSPVVPHGWSTSTVVAVDEGATGSVFRGVDVAGERLYAADFHADRVLVFDNRWRRISKPGAFEDRMIPAWYAPLSVRVLAGHVFVAYASPAPVDGNDSPTGGYVDEFDLAGRLVARVSRMGPLDEPWGLALAPRGFGAYGGDLLVANFGSGRIDAFRRGPDGWAFRGQLRSTSGKPLVLPGVWGIAFGNGHMAGPRTTLFFAAGPHRWRGASELDVHGLFGAVTPAS